MLASCCTSSNHQFNQPTEEISDKIKNQGELSQTEKNIEFPYLHGDLSKYWNVAPELEDECPNAQRAKNKFG